MTNRIKHIPVLTICLAAVSILFAGSAQGAGLSVVFAAQAQVSGDRIRIKDLASSITGQPQEAVRRLAETVVGPSPEPGKSKRIEAREINRLLAYDNLGLDRLQARIPPRITVSRGAARVSRAMMEQSFREAVEDNLPFVPDRVEITDIHIPKEMVLAPGELEIVPRFQNHSRMPGRVSLHLEFLINGRLVESKRVSGLVRFYQSTVVAALPIPRGRVIEKNDLTVVRRRIRGPQAEFYRDPGQVIGMKAKRAFLAGQPINPDRIERPILVKRGDRVVLVAEKGRLSITAKGVIRDHKGVLGDQVKVLNLTTKREVYGRLVDSGTVRVTF